MGYFFRCSTLSGRHAHVVLFFFWGGGVSLCMLFRELLHTVKHTYIRPQSQCWGQVQVKFRSVGQVQVNRKVGFVTNILFFLLTLYVFLSYFIFYYFLLFALCFVAIIINLPNVGLLKQFSSILFYSSSILHRQHWPVRDVVCFPSSSPTESGVTCFFYITRVSFLFLWFFSHLFLPNPLSHTYPHLYPGWSHYSHFHSLKFI